MAAQGKEIIRSTKSTDYGRPWPLRRVFNENNSSEASGLVMWPEALHFALPVLRRVVSWILSKALKLLKKLFSVLPFFCDYRSFVWNLDILIEDRTFDERT